MQKEKEMANIGKGEMKEVKFDSDDGIYFYFYEKILN